MKNNLKKQLKKFKLFRILKNLFFDNQRGYTKHNILETFPNYVPNSAGTYKSRSFLTIQTINQLPKFLYDFASIYNKNTFKTIDIVDFPIDDTYNGSILRLKEKLDQYGSDKANSHNYHLVYGTILKNNELPMNILEIGLGTNNSDVVSNMGDDGKPGASLRAFRDYLKNSNIYGADIDERILFNEERINTFFVDQTNPETFVELSNNLPNNFDLIIDDGLHSPNANILTLSFALGKIKEQGWVVIEDIPFEAELIWKIIPHILPTNYSCYLIKSKNSLLFAVQKLQN
jgi:hypothetical protein